MEEISFAFVFLAGLLSFLSPCVLPIVPGYLCFLAGTSLDKIMDEDYEGAASDFAGGFGRIMAEMLKKGAVTATEAFTGGQGVAQAFDKAFGQALNPYIEVSFQIIGTRGFSYSFIFAPRKAKETDEVRDIIKLFRFHMLPELKGTHHRYMGLPSTFDIHYMYQSGLPGVQAKENDFYNKIATCVLTDCDVNYTPDENVRSFDSGAPTRITMDLKFMETEMITSEMVAQGY